MISSKNISVTFHIYKFQDLRQSFRNIAPYMYCHGCPARLCGLQQVLMEIYAALKGNDDNNKPRPPPPPPTALDFPSCEPNGTDPANHVPRNLSRVFGDIKKGPTEDHILALNASLDGNVPIQMLVPEDYLPPSTWLRAPSQIKGPTDHPALVNGGSLPAHDAFHTRLRELQVSNENGYRCLRRVPLIGKEGPIRLLFFRTFWDELDHLADYWDTNQDRYMRMNSQRSSSAAMDVDELRRVVHPKDDSSRLTVGSETGDLEIQDTPRSQESSVDFPQSVATSQTAVPSSETTASADNPVSTNSPTSSFAPQNPTTKPSTRNATTDFGTRNNSDSAEAPPHPPQNDTYEDLYTGRRTSTGSLMPPQYRERCVFSFVESLALPFRLRLAEPRSQLKLQLGRVLIPLPHMASVLRVPSDQAQARQGLREGPLMGVMVAEFTKWRGEGEIRGEGGQERFHLLKEIGCILLLAQRRAREGVEEDVPGKGHWWAETRRWGGGSGVAVFTDPVQEATDSSRTARTGEGVPSLIEAQRRRVKRARRGWHEEEQRQKTKPNELVPPSRLWEKNVKYARIGMDREDGNECDDVSLGFFSLWSLVFVYRMISPCIRYETHPWFYFY